MDEEPTRQPLEHAIDNVSPSIVFCVKMVQHKTRTMTHRNSTTLDLLQSIVEKDHMNKITFS